MAINILGVLDSGFAILLVVMCLVMLSVSMLRRSHQRRATTRDLTREQFARLRDQKEVRSSMDDLLVQLEEASRRINAQVDTRFAKLEAVIREADEKIVRLEQMGHAAAPIQRAATPSPATIPTTAAPAISRGEQRGRIYELADKGTTVVTIADALSMPLGEVELILSLRDFRRSSHRPDTDRSPDASGR